MRGSLAACAALALMSAQVRPEPAGQTTLTTLVDAASAYIAQYQEQLTSVVADESYTQHVRAQVPRDKGMPPTRTMGSEIFFMYVHGHDWMAMRDVERLDGRPVTDRPDLMHALRTLPAPEVARRFKAYNSRFNLGRVVRNFNEPTLSLLVLAAVHRERFRFELRRMERVRGETLAVVGFREVAEPTLIRNLDGGPAYSSGEFTIAPSTGRVRRARLALTIGSVQMMLSTTYEQDARLDMLVPVRFGESYRDGDHGAGARNLHGASTPYEEIICEAKYTNFRRFEVKSIVR